MKEYSHQKIADQIHRTADMDGKKVLEVGCGDGRITSLMAGRPQDLIAIDPDSEKIRRARTTVAGVDFRIGSGENMAFSDKQFDLVIFTLSLHHQNSTMAIREATRVLRDDGLILVIEPLVDGEVEQLFALLMNENHAKKQAQRAIHDSGLHVATSETFQAKWIFTDKHDLLQSTFDYYDMPFDADVAEQISSLLGKKIESRPIVVYDAMVIQVLRKTA